MLSPKSRNGGRNGRGRDDNVHGQDAFAVGQFMEASDDEDSKQSIENDGAPDFTEIHDCLSPRPFRLP